MVFNNAQWNAPCWHFLVSVKHKTQFEEKKLLLHMLNTDIPSTFIHWIRSFLNDSRARAQLFNVFSCSWCFSQGLLQDSVLVLLLFLFYINDLVLCLKMMELLPSLLITSWSSLQLIKRRCWNCCPVSSKLSCDLEPGMEIKLERQQIWGISLLHLVQWHYLESYYLHWHSEGLR